MGNIIIKNKGTKEIYLTRYYNPIATYNINKDDVGFNNSSNPFSDYCFQTTCGIWQNDKIKILSLPDKGRLFYLTNPDDITPIYTNVTIGQMILVRDLIDKKVLKFNGEGSFNDQFTGNYLTSFKIERFCGIISNNQIGIIKLNMIEARFIVNELYEIIIPQTCNHTGDSPEDYDVICNGSNEFSLSESANIGVIFGFIKMTTNGQTANLKLTKQNGSNLIVNEVLPITDYLKASLINGVGGNSPGTYPFGTPSTPVPALYNFEYSLNGINDWQGFNLNIRA